MKNKILSIALVFMILPALTPAIQAQSDYEIVQSFKEKYRQLEEDIKNPQSLEELDGIYDRINSFREEYTVHRELLDRSLYPDNFNTSFEKLTNAYNVKKNDFTQIDILQVEVTGLREQLDTLNRHNEVLLNRVEILEKQSKSDKSRLAQLERTIGELRVSLQKRDEMVMNMIDSLLPQPYRERELSPQEKQEIYSKLGKENVLYNVKRLLSDNIRFIEITKLYPEDVDEIKEQQEDFARLWRSIGPKMVEIYSGKGDANYLKDIDLTFTQWKDALNQGIWDAVNSEFSKYDIKLSKFSSGKNFTEAVTSFINDEIKNADVKSKDAAIATYKDFADSAWYGGVKPEWVSNLIDYNMLSEAQKDTIEKKISEWNEKVSPAGMNYLYIIIAVVVIVAILFFFFRKRSGPKTETNEV
ncbi:MAG: hypothetical protein A2057_03720 [Ignavibacteria bacterium GWA2_35_9]|nr:MAG: hypothetical protein A2057_03720 [Ignavibacteria bacterium GWA2_35_9]OGU48591.1 MAG: hypothetical protein A2000_12525 [Ignavibacteria bacterium GWB2_36_8]OGU50520.1 MAG: hypothetical protein A2080_07100 [Ignavibacteria bacterium GWC2_36_12]